MLKQSQVNEIPVRNDRQLASAVIPYF